jgi:predicted dithiol-disulfide oxidoreductase (DUF899 family)
MSIARFGNPATLVTPTQNVPALRFEHDNTPNCIFHTYSTFGRGIDLMNTAYNYLDLVPKGRDEKWPPDVLVEISR